MIVAAFEGTASVEAWESAAAALVNRHPLSQVNIRGGAGTFALVPADQGNLRFWQKKRGKGEGWKEVSGRWLAGRMGISSEQLVRQHGG